MPQGIDKYVKRGQEQGLALNKRRQEMAAKKFDTIAVHGIYSMQEALQNQGSIIEPIYTSTAQHFNDSDHLEAALAYMIPAWGYTRIANPSIHYLEQTLSLLEGYGFDIDLDTVATSSGMSAVFMATNPFLSQEKNSKMNFVASGNCYGGTFMLFSERYGKEQSVDVRWIRNNLDLSEWKNAIDDNTRFIYTEMPSNPGLAVADLKELAKLAHAHNIPLIVDSTLTSPALMRPLEFGADIVIHSVSKVMNASGMSIAGAIVARHNISSKHLSDEAKANFAHYVKLLPARDFGPALSPFSAVMILNDLRSLRSRVKQMSETAMQVATALEANPNVEAVHYPGLKSNQSHEIAKKYMKLVDSDEQQYGYLMGFRVKNGIEATRKVFDKFNMIWRATDLGRAKTVATIPAISTHQQQGEEGRELASIPANLIRLSIGLEHAQDIIADLEQALS
ncbi:MAG TPA: O-acetylhomoserine aminocarboxypropyltransferase/cysteine synthase [Trueperaceae bacterium]|nr:O-acetylhomoserine aminocarboxypropyltransferase/cysteine synthase [Trueperaceae bacterium]